MCDKCVNNLNFNEATSKCACEEGYKLSVNKTCEKIPGPDPNPDNGSGYIKLRSWQLFVGLSVLITLNFLICVGVVYCLKRRMRNRNRRDASLIGSEHDTIVEPYKAVGNSYVPYGSYGTYGQYKPPGEQSYFQEKRNE
jgi:hypothetical protein